MEPSILIVDDEKPTRDGLRMSLEDYFEVYTASDKNSALDVLQADNIEVMVTDLRLGGDDGMTLIDEVLKLPNPPICIMMTAFGSVDTAVEAMKRGAYDFVSKPINLDELEILIRRALKSKKLEKENKELKKTVAHKFSTQGIIGVSDSIRNLIDLIEQIADSKSTVLIEGESGTGKELVAKALHHLSNRKNNKLVTVHCAALAPQLLESELFGHEKGAFTGATTKRIGRFEAADKGTLFLDELGEIEPSTQVKLLRALGEQTIERVGGNQSIKVDVRVVAATNKNLEQLVADGLFREDLYYRLNVVRVKMPALRERKEDISILAEHFIKEMCKEHTKEEKTISSDAMQALITHDWPGNVRELKTVIEHGIVMCNSNKITPRHLPHYLTDQNPRIVSRNDNSNNETPNDFNLENLEKKTIELALEKTSGNRTEAARILGISRRTLHRKLALYEDS